MKTRRAPIVDRKLRFALVGCGRIAQNHIEALHRHAGEAELAAVCDTDPVALNAAVQATHAQGFDSLTALLAGSQPDCVALATPSGLHPQQVIEIAAAGVEVMTEKPMATRWSDGLAMVRACDEAGVRLFVVKQNRRNRTLQLLKQAIGLGGMLADGLEVVLRNASAADEGESDPAVADRRASNVHSWGL